MISIRHRLQPLPAVLLAGLLTAGATVAATETAEYRVTFDAAWSAQSHPVDFPDGRAHFSSLIGGTHGGAVTLWAPGALASEGIERMAEIGSTSPLDAEVQAAIDAGTAREIVRGGAIAVSPGRASATFTVSREHPLISLVSMIAPSPDWFVGVHDHGLFVGGDWVGQQTVELFAYDAGTDSGPNFTSGNADTNPPEPIRRIDSGSLANGVALGTFTFTRLDTPPPPALALRDGRFEVTLTWRDGSQQTGVGQPRSLTEETGFFWFFDEDNVEVIVKILDGCSINGRYWLFASGLTDVEVELTAVDTSGGASVVHRNPLGVPFAPISEVEAFATCP